MRGEKPLSWDEQLALFEAMRPPASLAVRDAARNRIVETNLRLSVKVVNRFMAARHAPPWVTRDDLDSVAAWAVLLAAETFDPASGGRFTTLAGRSVWFRLVRYCGTEVRPGVRLSAHAADTLRGVNRARRAAGDGPSDDDLMRSLGWSDERRGSADSLLKLVRASWSGSDPAGDEGFRIGDARDRTPPPWKRAEDAEAARSAVERLMRPLEAKHRRAVTLRYGLDGGGERKLREIGTGANVRENARAWLDDSMVLMRWAARCRSMAIREGVAS